jgi:hypothetical protein
MPRTVDGVQQDRNALGWPWAATQSCRTLTELFTEGLERAGGSSPGCMIVCCAALGWRARQVGSGLRRYQHKQQQQHNPVQDPDTALSCRFERASAAAQAARWCVAQCLRSAQVVSSLPTPACVVSADAVPAFCCFDMHQVGCVVLSVAQAGSL